MMASSINKVDILNRKLFPNQVEVQEKLISILKEQGGALLQGNMGFGKGSLSLITAYELGYTNVLYITEPRLIPHIEYHSKLNVKALPFSKMKLEKNSIKCVESVAKELLKGVDSSYFVIVDECSAISNYTSQRGRVFLKIRHLLRDNPFILMSGTIKPNNNAQLVPYLYTVPNRYVGVMGYREMLKRIGEDCERYCPKIPIPHVSRFAFKREDVFTDELKEYIATFTVKADKVRVADINLYEKILSCPCSDEFIEMAKRLKESGAIGLDDGRFVNYHANQLQRLADGYYNAINPETGITKSEELSFNPKILALKKLLPKLKNKVIILTAFRESARLVANHFNSLLYDVSSSKKDQTKVMDEFKHGSCNIIVSTVSALSTGFNLDMADNIVYYSLGYNIKDYIQSQGRIDRATSTRSKYYYYLHLDWAYEKARLRKIREKMQRINADFGFPQPIKTSAIGYEDI